MSKVAVIMGSLSDLPIMQEAIDILKGFDIEVEVDIVSAHRTPDKLYEFSKQAHKNGFAVIIAGAGMAVGLSPWVIAELSNIGGGQVCEKPGIVPVNKDQLLQESAVDSLGHDPPGHGGKHDSARPHGILAG